MGILIITDKIMHQFTFDARQRYKKTPTHKLRSQFKCVVVHSIHNNFSSFPSDGEINKEYANLKEYYNSVDGTANLGWEFKGSATNLPSCISEVLQQ